MDKLNLSFFYGLGAALQPLANMDAGKNTRADIIIAAFNVRMPLDNLLLTFSDLRTCRQKGAELQTIIGAITEMVQKQEVGDWSEVPQVTDWQFFNVINVTKQFALVLAEELQGLLAYHPRQTAILDTIALAERGEQVLLESVRNKLDPKVVEDVRESGKCLAFAVYTACGFHMMRAVEAVLHQYWVLACSPKEPIPERLDNWGEYIAQLRTGDAEAKEVAAMVQQIKDLKRNNIMHPEMVLNQDEAYAMFVLGQGAVMAMAKRLPSRPAIVNVPIPSGIFAGLLAANGDSTEAASVPGE